MTSEKADTRRYGTMTKAQVVAHCAEFGASVAKIAMANGINANVVHRWRKLARGGDAKAATKQANSSRCLDDGSTAGAAHHIGVGGCGLAHRTAPQREQDVHRLAEQRCRRIRFLDPATSSVEPAAIAAHSDRYSNHLTR